MSYVLYLFSIFVRKTDNKQLTVCFQFPEEHPTKPVFIELKTKVMSDQLLHKITKIAEDHAKTLDAKGQVKAISSCLFPCKSVMYFEFVFFFRLLNL